MTKLNRSIERGLDILEVISDKGPSSLKSLAEQTGLPKATILRNCATLESRRWLLRRRGDDRYQFGSGFPHLDGAPKLVDALVEAGKDEIVHLSEMTGLGVDLAASIGEGRVEIVDSTRQYAKHGIFGDCIGFRPCPYRSALGASYLAALPNQKFADVVSELGQRNLEKDQSALAALPALRRTIRSRGYACREENHWGRAVDYGEIPGAVGVAILTEGQPIGAVNLVWAAKNQSLESIVELYVSKLQAAAEVIGQEISKLI